MKRGPRAAGALIVLGVALIAGPALMMSQAAGDESGLGVFNVQGDSIGIGASFGNPASQPNPVVAALVPNTVAQLGSGPSGYALSSVAWPGPLAGNAGSLANVIGTPLPPEVVGNANDPVKAEAAAGGGAKDEKTVGPMYAVVDGPRSEARATINDFGAGAAISAHRIFTKSLSVVDQTKSTAIGETELNGVELAAGQVKFDSIRTSAKGVTDGVQATTEHHAVVSGFTVAGNPMVVDENGTHAAGNNSANPLDPGVDAGNTALKGMNMTIYMTKPSEQRGSAGSAVVNSGAVIVDWNFFGSGNHVIYTLGGSSARVAATPNVSGGLVDSFDSFAAPVTSDTPGFTPSLDASSGGLEGTVVTGASPNLYAGGSSPGLSRPGSTVAGLELDAVPAAKWFGGVPAGWLGIGFVSAGFMGLGFKRMREAILDSDRVVKCPLASGG